jgi:hypothetical protein
VNPGEADLKLQSTLAAQISADGLIALAIRHRVEPLLLHNLKRHPRGVFPEQLLESLAARNRRNAVKSLQALRINMQLDRLLRSRGIPFLPMKGVTVAQRYYGNMNLRHANDVDFWVPPEAVETVRALLVDQGYQPDQGVDFEDLAVRGVKHREFLRGRYHHDVLIHPDGTHLEIHWRLTANVQGFLVDPSDFLLSGERVNVAGEVVNTMAPVQLLLYLCEHGSRHGWYRLKWLMDLPQVLESREWDWPAVLAEAKRANCKSALLLGLRMAHVLFGWTVPELVAAAMNRQQFLNWQVRMVCRNLAVSNSAIANPPLSLDVLNLIYRASLIESFGFVWRELMHVSLSGYDLRTVRLPDSLFPAYYVLRPMLFIWRRLFKFWRARGVE